MADLMYLLNGLVDPNGKILVPGVYDSVKPLTEEEKNLYDAIDFDQVFFIIKVKKSNEYKWFKFYFNSKD